MMNLAEYRRSNTRLADFLPWAALVGEGVVLNKDGSFQRTARFRGPDLDSAVSAELVAVAGRLNSALRRLGSGWVVFVEAQRHSASRYPASTFPDAASALVDAERRAQFEEAGAHYESSYFLTFLYLPPAQDAARAERFLYEGRDRSENADVREVRQSACRARRQAFSEKSGRLWRMDVARCPNTHNKKNQTVSHEMGSETRWIKL
jgi:type IV secretory pathway VirB4 component